MSARTLHRIRWVLVLSGIIGGLGGAISVSAWEVQTGRPLELPFLSPAENENGEATAEPIPAALVVGFVPAAIGVFFWAILKLVPARCPNCGALAVFQTPEERRYLRYRCRKCDEVDPNAPMTRSARPRRPGMHGSG